MAVSGSRIDIQMVDLKRQYQKIQPEIDQAVLNVIQSAAFINGPTVRQFQDNLATYLQVKHVIPCANGTDALQLALMALELQPGDEVIVPSFTYVATAEVIGLLRLKPVMVDVDPLTFNITPEIIEAAITPRTKAIVPVHLFGQSADMEPIMSLARKHNLYVVEDNAQAIGARYFGSDGTAQYTGTIAHIGCTSFFPSKNLGCYGDGGAIFTQDDALADKLRMLANHGQSRRYYHDLIGVNSRLDSIQAAILDIKLRHLDTYNEARRAAADYYDAAFEGVKGLTIPYRSSFSTHVFHQYTLQLEGKRRDALVEKVQQSGVPCMIYYPVPLYRQRAFSNWVEPDFSLPVTESLCQQVFSLPIHSELTNDIQDEIISVVLDAIDSTP
jgi:UDP-2-acetamido-2-deoxy-ribo-hexuluronate aminotransferase